MKKNVWQLTFSAVVLSCALFIACQKESPTDPDLIAGARGGNGNGNNGNGGGNGGGGGTTTSTVSTRTCYLGQGYWFGSGKRTWPDLNGTNAGVITIGGTGSPTFSYTQDEALNIWKSSNAGGMKDAKKVFVLLVQLQLSGNNVPTYNGMTNDVTTLSSWLNGLNGSTKLNASNLPSTKMGTTQKAAYNRLKDWIESHECSDDDEICSTDIVNWFGSNAQTTWPDVNGTAAGNITIGGFTYTQAEAAAVWNYYVANSSNSAPHRVFLALAALRLSQFTGTPYSGFANDVTTLETWLQSFGKFTSTNNPTTAMTPEVTAAYNRLTDWIEDSDCD